MTTKHCDEIEPLCKEVFISKTTGIKTLYIVGAIIVSVICTAVTWAYSTNSSVIKIESEQSVMKDKISKLDEDINKKLDILIGRK